MRLYVVQHGDALPKVVDPDRPLSDRGRADIQRLAAWLFNRGVKVARVLHSGKTRALETAELFQSLLVPSSEIEAGEQLGPNDSPDFILGQLAAADEDTLIAGHMPFVSRLVSQAVSDSSHLQLVEFIPGSVAGLERANRKSIIRAL
jgi:phosphohistidine phosphatase